MFNFDPRFPFDNCEAIGARLIATGCGKGMAVGRRVDEIDPASVIHFFPDFSR
ncbi:hypothetical protein [Lichenicola sp.]|uniref:hypothetical protein n=1 Tax=Lichenicola sp. TaxID=2804529 RepID=UPI003B003ADA